MSVLARDWAKKADARKLAVLVLVSTPHTPPQQRLRGALSSWTGKNQIKAQQEKESARAFFFDAVDQAELAYKDAATRQAIDSGATVNGDAGTAQRDRAAIERAKKLTDGTKVNTRAFGPERNAGGMNPGAGGQAGAGSGGNQFKSVTGGVSSTAGAGSGGLATTNSVAPGGSGGTIGAGPGAYLPAANIPAIFKKANVVPPLATVDLSPSDRVINKALSVVNLEAYSRGDTVNKESSEGTQAAICRFLVQAKYDPDEAWGLSKAARDKPGADPGDLDLRNAEHYLYAYSTTNKPGGWGDSTPVQLLMAVGWTPFKTVTKHVRPTSTPSMEEAKWGVKGAWAGQHPPDWRSTCEPKSGTSI